MGSTSICFGAAKAPLRSTPLRSFSCLRTTSSGISPRPAISRKRFLVPTKAAAEEAAGTDFSFSLGDAKRNNEFSSSDVQAALRFYQDGEGTAPLYENDFVTNTMGTEDASFFDDVDNNEAYAADEYVAAGIPEAAPKKRQTERQRDDQQAEGDDLEQAKNIDRIRDMEDRMVMEASMEQDFGDAKSETEKPGVGKLAMWDWLMDPNAGDVDEEQFESARNAMQRQQVGAGETTEGDLFPSMNVASSLLAENPVLLEYLELFSEGEVNEESLKLIGEVNDAEQLPDSCIGDEDIKRLDAVIDSPVPVMPDEDLKVPKDSSVPKIDTNEPELDKQTIDDYLAKLRAAMKGDSEVTEQDVKNMFGDAAQLEPSGTLKPEDPAVIDKLLAYSADDFRPQEFNIEALANEIMDVSEESREEDDGGYTAELKELANIGDFDPDFLTEEELYSAESYLTAAEDFVADEETRKAELARQVAAGEAPPDALAEDLELAPDAMDEIVAQMDSDDSDLMAQDDDDDNEQWIERIVELTRVVKVVKGGSIQGFRCVAIVGNSNGLVGVGCQAAREVAMSVKRTLLDAKKNVVRVPLVGAGTIPHRVESKFKAARCVVRPASDGTGCIAGGAVRSVLELAGVKNCLAKRIGSRSALNSARATIKAMEQLQTLREVSDSRGVPFERLLLPQ